jgi:methyl-accepting chemotaxis protein
MAFHDWVLTIFVAVTAVAVVLMVVILAAVSRALVQLARTMERIQDTFEREVNPMLHGFNEFIAAASEPTRRILNNLSETSDILRARAQSADALAAEVIERARAEVIRADRFITGSLEMMERATEAVERGVMVPVREITALVAGLRQGFAFLFSRRRPSPAREGAPVEEQLFI